MLSDQDWLYVLRQLRQQFGSLSLKCRDELGAYGVTLKYH